MKLIKLKEKFILVSDEEVKEGDWVIFLDRFLIYQIEYNSQLFDYNNDTGCKKIIAGILETKTINFNGFEEELSNITTANVKVVLENNVYLITKIIKDE